MDWFADIVEDDEGFFWLECECGYRQGPFTHRGDARIEEGEHILDHTDAGL